MKSRIPSSGIPGGSALHRARRGWTLLACAALLSTGAARVRADQVEMQNGDRFTGKVLSLNGTTLTLQNELLGTLHLPRSKVLQINLGDQLVPRPTAAPNPATTNATTASAAATPNGNLELSLMLRQLAANTNLIRQVQEQFLSAAGPEANSKFNELVGGLANGTVSVNDLRAQANTAANQLRSMKRDLGDDAGWVLDGYLSILDNFLNETAPSATPAGSSLNRTATPTLGLQPKR